jgi:hypothetical protein
MTDVHCLCTQHSDSHRSSLIRCIRSDPDVNWRSYNLCSILSAFTCYESSRLSLLE